LLPHPLFARLRRGANRQDSRREGRFALFPPRRAGTTLKSPRRALHSQRSTLQSPEPLEKYTSLECVPVQATDSVNIFLSARAFEGVAPPALKFSEWPPQTGLISELMSTNKFALGFRFDNEDATTLKLRSNPLYSLDNRESNGLSFRKRQPSSCLALSQLRSGSQPVAEKAQLLERPAAAAFALDRSITVRDSEVTNVTAAPVIAPRKIRQTLRMTAALLS
jgi:hypothetical protein